MADEDENDFDVEVGGTDKGSDAGKAVVDDDDLEDLSREELYDKLKSANDTAKKYRLRLKRARSGDRAPVRRESRKDDRDDDDERDDSRDSKRSRTRDRDDDRDSRNRDDRRDDDRKADRYRTELIESRAETELARAGIPADKVARAVRLIDVKSLELDGRDLIGIEDEIDELKDEWPELFEKKRSRDDEDDERPRRRRIPRADLRSGNGRDDRGGRREKTATEIQAERLATFGNQ